MSNSWYMQNFPISLELTDCRNCQKHRAPSLDTTECVYCEEIEAHVYTTKAEDCIAFLSCLDEAPIEKEVIPDIASFMLLAEQMGETQEVNKEEAEETEEAAVWKGQSQLDAQAFGFDDKTVPAALRAMFDILKGMEKRLTKIEEKMPSNRTWKVKNFFGSRKDRLRTWKNRWKWKLIYRFRRFKTKAKSKKTGFAALFAPKST